MKRPSMVAPTPYAPLNAVLRELVGSARKILGPDFVGAYLQGSFALGDFDEHSDCDFIVAAEGELTDDQVHALQMMHGRIFDGGPEWAKHLEGSYFPKAILRTKDRLGEPLWYLDNGSRQLIRSDHCNQIHVRWILRERGVVLAGPSPETLIDSVSSEDLRRESFQGLSQRGEEVFNHPEEYQNRFYQTYLVLTFCRMLCGLYEGSVVSKRTGAQWAKKNLDPSWSDLIDRAWAGRPNPAQSVREPADPQDFARTLEFVRYVIDKSKRMYRADIGRT
jgi:hypothetical protein